MARRAKAARAKTANVGDEIANIENLIADLQQRLRKLDGTVRTEAAGASSDVNDFVSESLAGIMERLRAGSEHISEDAAETATKVSRDAFKRISQEVEQRPLILLGVAAGIGFLLGMARR